MTRAMLLHSDMHGDACTSVGGLAQCYCRATCAMLVAHMWADLSNVVHLLIERAQTCHQQQSDASRGKAATVGTARRAENFRQNPLSLMSGLTLPRRGQHGDWKQSCPSLQIHGPEKKNQPGFERNLCAPYVASCSTMASCKSMNTLKAICIGGLGLSAILIPYAT